MRKFLSIIIWFSTITFLVACPNANIVHGTKATIASSTGNLDSMSVSLADKAKLAFFNNRYPGYQDFILADFKIFSLLTPPYCN